MKGFHHDDSEASLSSKNARSLQIWVNRTDDSRYNGLCVPWYIGRRIHSSCSLRFGQPQGEIALAVSRAGSEWRAYNTVLYGIIPSWSGALLLSLLTCALLAWGLVCHELEAVCYSSPYLSLTASLMGLVKIQICHRPEAMIIASRQKMNLKDKAVKVQASNLKHRNPTSVMHVMVGRWKSEWKSVYI